MLQEFKDVFSDKVPILPPNRNIDFIINLVPGEVAISCKATYRMITPKLVELNIQIHELMDKKYIRPSVSPWGSLMLFVKKTDGTLRLCIDYM